MRALPLLALVLAGCALDPLVEDEPQVSVHILPPGTEVPDVSENAELVHQIEVHDGLDDGALVEAEGVIPRAQAWANGVPVSYWAFGNATRITAFAYILVDGDTPIDHPWILDTIPGDPGYSAFRRLSRVQVTPAYDGEVLPDLDALFDAIELGLVEEPQDAVSWVDAPVVVPGTTLAVADDQVAEPIEAYAAGWRVDYFAIGTALGEQPLRNGNISATQMSRLREGMSAGFSGKPVFQAALPTEPPTDRPNFLPLVTQLEVRLAPGVVAATDVDADADLYVRSMTGSISAYTVLVDSYTVTTTTMNWPMQLEEGKP